MNRPNEDVLKKAGQLLAQRRHREVIALLEHVRNQDARNAQALFLLGLSHYRENDFAAAVKSLSEAATVQPDHAEAAYYLGLAYEEQGLDGPAKTAFEKALQARPGFPPAVRKLRQHAGQAKGEQDKPVPIADRVANPSAPAPKQRRGSVRGTVASLQNWSEKGSFVLSFRLHPDGGGNPVAVELRSKKPVGHIQNGDSVEVKGGTTDGIHKVKRFKNLTTDVVVKASSSSDSSWVTVSIFVLVFLVALVLYIMAVNSTGT
ncbi:MAG TPA: tetratricopeptide repeat protein [Dehalococcoidia bacterium]|nr:tetratricopeptide repeat protein [Dehalococcoidia bacterium]